MKKFSGLIKRGEGLTRSATNSESSEGRNLENFIAESINAFAESGNPNRRPGPNDKDETVYLSEIVETAEASPSAARRAAITIRTILDKKSKSKPYAKYNAIMLIEILGRNPGKTFVDNLDKDFAESVKYVLKNELDVSVQESLRHTLNWLDATKGNEEGPRPVLEMWRAERGAAQMRRPVLAPQQGHLYGYAHQPSRSKSLPPPDELASRLEEAVSTAKLLSQTAQAAGQDELVQKESFVHELGERVQNANRSIQSYINSTTPYPDNRTLATLIDAYQTLTISQLKYYRTVLEARKALGDPGATVSTEASGAISAQPVPQPGQLQSTGAAAAPPPRSNSQSPAASTPSNGQPALEDPFSDNSQAQPPRQPYTLFTRSTPAQPQASAVSQPS